MNTGTNTELNPNEMQTAVGGLDADKARDKVGKNLASGGAAGTENGTASPVVRTPSVTLVGRRSGG